ncbi:viral A-type inclusion protein, putative [Trichomonas vaginalis G3]|uniref:Viral A-type inclusion protein, putative n=1 Tax=Trichomonas vaginalis (strain ATCC PRA-98 / G3) TaxID=412133 RepID=A2E4S4_TRIV3|nr:A-type inclusion protein-related family [Trichomonas vaginalis G3]EAY12384.1 viral A-type inclusion protein, putative [Trichomonas vaginalis G3]KAI5500801.1 A-type inclusion protein-related family [Trichomonas vaginalis G3]|eukprot:XP_001324607.1 viral A-type inclusion protein [Trichomonas vaginalis G3]
MLESHSSNSSLEEREEALEKLRLLVSQKQQQIDDLLLLKDQNREYKQKIREFSDKVIKQKSSISEKNKMISRIYLEFDLNLESDFQENLEKLITIAKQYKTYQKFINSIGILFNIDNPEEDSKIQEITEQMMQFSETSTILENVQTLLHCSKDEIQKAVENLVQEQKPNQVAHNHIADILEMTKWDADNTASAIGSLKHNFMELNNQFDDICSILNLNREKANLPRDISRLMHQFEDIKEKQQECENHIQQLKEILHEQDSDADKLIDVVTKLKKESDITNKKAQLSEIVNKDKINELQQQSNLISRLKQLVGTMDQDVDLEQSTQRLIAENVSNKQILDEILEALPERSIISEATISEVIKKAISKSDAFDDICQVLEQDPEKIPYSDVVNIVSQLQTAQISKSKTNNSFSIDNNKQIMDGLLSVCEGADSNNISGELNEIKNKLNELFNKKQTNSEILDLVNDIVQRLAEIFGLDSESNILEKFKLQKSLNQYSDASYEEENAENTTANMQQLAKILNTENANEIPQKVEEMSEQISAISQIVDNNTCDVIENVKELKNVVDEINKILSAIKRNDKSPRKPENERLELVNKVREMRDCLSSISKLLDVPYIADLPRKIKEMKERISQPESKTEESIPFSSKSKELSPIKKDEDFQVNSDIEDLENIKDMIIGVFDGGNMNQIYEILQKLKDEIIKGDDDQEVANIARSLFIQDELDVNSTSPRTQSSISLISLSPLTPKMNKTVDSVENQVKEMSQMKAALDAVCEELGIEDTNEIVEKVKELNEDLSQFHSLLGVDDKEQSWQRVKEMIYVLDKTKNELEAKQENEIPKIAKNLKQKVTKISEILGNPKDLERRVQQLQDENTHYTNSAKKAEQQNSDKELLEIIGNVTKTLNLKDKKDISTKVQEMKGILSSVSKTLRVDNSKIKEKVNDYSNIVVQCSVLLDSTKNYNEIPQKLKEIKQEMDELKEILDTEDVNEEVMKLNDQMNEIKKVLETDDALDEVKKLKEEKENEIQEKMENLKKMDQIQSSQKIICGIVGKQTIDDAINEIKSLKEQIQKLKNEISVKSDKILNDIKEKMKLPEATTEQDLVDAIAVMEIENEELKENDKKLREIFNSDISVDTLEILKEVENLKQKEDQLKSLVESENLVDEIQKLNENQQRILDECDKSDISEVIEEIKDLKKLQQDVENCFPTNDVSQIKEENENCQQFLEKLNEIFGFDNDDDHKAEITELVSDLKKNDQKLRGVMKSDPETETKTLINEISEKIPIFEKVTEILGEENLVEKVQELSEMKDISDRENKPIAELLAELKKELNDLKNNRKEVLTILKQPQTDDNILKQSVQMLVNDKNACEEKLAKTKLVNEKMTKLVSEINSTLLVNEDDDGEEAISKIKDLQAELQAANEEMKNMDDYVNKVKNELRKLDNFGNGDLLGAISAVNESGKVAALEMKREKERAENIRLDLIRILSIDDSNKDFDEIEDELIDLMKKQQSLQIRLATIFNLPENHQSFSEICIAAKRVVDQLNEKSTQSNESENTEEEIPCSKCSALEEELKSMSDELNQREREINSQKKEISSLKDEIENLEDQISTLFSKLGTGVTTMKEALDNIKSLRRDSELLKKNEYKYKKVERVNDSLQKFKHEQTAKYRGVAEKLSDQADMMKKTLEKTIRVSNETGSKQLELAQSLSQIDEDNKKLMSMLESPRQTSNTKSQIPSQFTKLPCESPLSNEELRLFKKKSSSGNRSSIDVERMRMVDDDQELIRKKRKLSKIEKEITFNCSCSNNLTNQSQTLL